VQTSLAPTAIFPGQPQHQDADGPQRARPAGAHIEASLTGLRNNKEMDELPRALVLRAVLRRVTGQFEMAEKDLREATTGYERRRTELDALLRRS
jgi:hypothetical protein